MNINEKVALSFRIGQLAFALPEIEIERLAQLLEARKTLHSRLFGAVLNKRYGATEQRVREELKTNAKGISDWSSQPTNPTTDDGTCFGR